MFWSNSYWAKSFKSKKYLFHIKYTFLRKLLQKKKNTIYTFFSENTQYNTIVCDMISYLTKRRDLRREGWLLHW